MECDYEVSAQRNYAAQMGLESSPEDSAIDGQLCCSLDAYKSAANACLAEYREVIGKAAQQLFEKWSNSLDSNVKMIGEAAAASDYSTLAI